MKRVNRAAIGAACVWAAMSAALGQSTQPATQFVAPPPAQPIARDAVSHGKAATALMDAGKAGSGSGFCIDPGGLFITNNHVVEDLPAGQEIKVVINPGEAAEHTLKGIILRTDKDLDLALISARDAKALPALELGTIDQLVETAELMAFGFPFGKALAFEDGKYPSISVSVGRVTSLRKSAGRLEAIQLDASVNPGNSGGPVLDKGGKVVGVIVAGIRGAALNFAIPVSHVHEFLHKPVLDFNPPALNVATAGKPAVFEVRAVTFAQPKPALTLELTITSGGEARKVAMTGDGGTYRATLVPVPVKEGPAELEIKARFAKGTVEGTTADLTFTVGDQKVRLGQVRTLDGPPYPKATLPDGKTLEGAIGGLTSVTVKLAGESKTTVDLSKALSVEIHAPETPSGVEYRIAALEKGAVVGELTGTLPIDGGTGPVAGGPAGAPGRTVDLLKLVDPAKDTVRGVWRMAPDGLACVVSAQPAKFRIRYEPPQEYDFIMEFTRVGNVMVSPILWRGEAGFGVQIAGMENTVIAVDAVDGHGAGDPQNCTRVLRNEVLKSGKRYHAVFRVRKDSVTVLLEGQEVIRLKTEGHTLDITGWDVGHRLLGVGNWGGPTTYHKLELIPITGTGKPVK